MIRFDWKGKMYKVSMEAYDKNRIVLPDGTLLAANSWLESMPPQPAGLHEINHMFSGSSPEEIAEHMNGVVAHEVG